MGSSFTLLQHLLELNMHDTESLFKFLIMEWCLLKHKPKIIFTLLLRIILKCGYYKEVQFRNKIINIT